MLRALLECLGKSDERREERDQSGQELPERFTCGGVPPLLRARLSNYVIASYIIGRHNIASYNVKEAEGPSCVVGDGALPDRVVFSIFG